LGGYTQNANESLNALIWTLAPKIRFSGSKCVESAVNIASSIFNHGYSSIILMMNTMNILIGPITANICEALDEERISTAERRSFEATKEGRISRRQSKSTSNDEEEHYYEAGMAD
jgi:hypothetical protein